MKTLEKGQDKIKKICDELRKETLEPAQAEGQKIIEQAKVHADQLIADAEAQIAKMHAAAKQEIEQEKNVFQSSLQQAMKQGMEALRQSVENKLFNDQLQTLIQAGTTDPQVIAKIIDAIVKAIDKSGISADFSAVIPKAVSEKDVNKVLGEGILAKLKDKTVVLGDFAGGAQVKLHDKRITIELTDAALKELLARYVRKDFRKLVFAN